MNINNNQTNVTITDAISTPTLKINPYFPPSPVSSPVIANLLFIQLSENNSLPNNETSKYPTTSQTSPKLPQKIFTNNVVNSIIILNITQDYLPNEYSNGLDSKFINVYKNELVRLISKPDENNMCRVKCITRVSEGLIPWRCCYINLELSNKFNSTILTNIKQEQTDTIINVLDIIENDNNQLEYIIELNNHILVGKTYLQLFQIHIQLFLKYKTAFIDSKLLLPTPVNNSNIDFTNIQKRIKCWNTYFSRLNTFIYTIVTEKEQTLLKDDKIDTLLNRLLLQGCDYYYSETKGQIEHKSK
ncbi:uncharacterized protein SCDLUD_000092 [Saccharomycodes ludwigii]|uniref:uncharacterized protein n=1 Tax=Saccharomycodes ludwigii TaxID=36035 RepID=UPI001E82BDEB|nr:hypothetical protein SCDLUD_000092 [Saccharomycodes ludwigii]KAH3902515.1 hypothetical protein SCDLUD_000092 [Saccharomycodes ludwigii]